MKDLDFLSLVMIFFLLLKSTLAWLLDYSRLYGLTNSPILTWVYFHRTTQCLCSPASWIHFGWKRRATRRAESAWGETEREKGDWWRHGLRERISTEFTIPTRGSRGNRFRIFLWLTRIINFSVIILLWLRLWFSRACEIFHLCLTNNHPTAHRCQLYQLLL